MGFSVLSPTNTSSMMAELALSQQGEAQDTEGLMLSEDLMDPQMLKDLAAQGTLKGETKSYTFVMQEGFFLNQTLKETFSHAPAFSKTYGESKNPLTPHSKSILETKEFQHLEASAKKAQDAPIKKDVSQTHLTAHHTLAQARPQAKEPPPLRQLFSHPLSQEQKPAKEPSRQETKRTESSANKNHVTEGRKATTEREREIIAPQMQKSDKYEERQQEREKQKHDDEEGFAEQERRQQQSPDDREENRVKVEKIEASSFTKDFVKYSVEESILSEIFKMRISQFDVLILFIEILKIDIKSREQEKLARRQERELQLIHMQKMVENYKSQGQWLMFSSLGSGILAIVSGVCPIIGHTKGGDWILQKLGGVFSSLSDMKKDQFFKGATKITFAMSEMYKSTGQIHQTFSEGSRTYDQHMSDIHRSDWEENTRSIEEIKDSWKGIENFLYQSLQMYHDAIRQLYSH